METSLVNHRLWTRLCELNAVAASTFPVDYDPGFGCLGLILHEPARYNYWCTPLNVVTFATTGGDGVHFSFLLQDGAVTDASPVVITVPAAFGCPNWIGGRDLYDFLCLGYHRGYFAVEQVAYDLDLTLKAFTDATWEPSEDWHYSAGFCLDEQKSRVMDFLASELDLKPWANSMHFGNLQDQYAGFLVLPE